MKSAGASHLLWHFKQEAGSICSAEELVEGSWPHGFCTLSWADCTFVSLHFAGFGNLRALGEGQVNTLAGCKDCFLIVKQRNYTPTS